MPATADRITPAVPKQPQGTPPPRRTPRTPHALGVPLAATLSMLPLHLYWALDRANGGGDLAAQETWARFAAEHGGSAYGLFWFGGAHTANYSVVSPYLMALLGVPAVAVLSGLASAWLAAVLIRRAGIRRPLLPALTAAFGLWVNVAAGRVTFALGVAFALAALVALGRRRSLAALLALLATAGSPVAGLFLVTIGAAHLLTKDRARAAALVLPPVLLVATTTLLFPYQGQEPMATSRIWWPLGLGLAVALAAPRAWRVVRLSGAVYAVGVLLCYVIPTPIGTNVERFALLFAPAVLLAAWLETPHPKTPVRGTALAVALAASVYWVGSGTPTSFLRGSSEVPAWATHTDGVVQELGRLGADRTRVEVVPAEGHRDSAVLSPYVNLARGWNTQLDMERGRLFYDGAFSEARYRAWVDHWAVGFVVVPDARPDHYGIEEAELIQRGPAWLEPVWSDAHWRIYRVRDAVPLAEAPASVVATGGAELSVRIPAAGSVTVRIAYSPWLHAEGAKLAKDGDFTRITVEEPGVYRIGSGYLDGLRALSGRIAK